MKMIGNIFIKNGQKNFVKDRYKVSRGLGKG